MKFAENLRCFILITGLLNLLPIRGNRYELAGLKCWTALHMVDRYILAGSHSTSDAACFSKLHTGKTVNRAYRVLRNKKKKKIKQNINFSVFHDYYCTPFLSGTNDKCCPQIHVFAVSQTNIINTIYSLHFNPIYAGDLLDFFKDKFAKKGIFTSN